MTFFALGPQSTEARRHYLDVMRGLAAFLVLVSHADHSGLMNLGLDSIQKGFVGSLGVYVFFILSGFLIWTSARDLPGVDGAKIYMVHRVTRLMPLYLLNIAFVVLVLPHIWTTFQPTITGQTLVRHLTFTQSLLPPVSRDLNPVLWTLTHEAIFYLLVPLLMLLPRLTIPALGAAAFFLPSGVSGPLQPFTALFFLFTIGIMFAERRFLLGLLVMAVVTAAGATRMPLWQTLVVPTSALIVLVGLHLPGAMLQVTLPFRWMGMMSYSLYIWHYLLINIIGTQEGLRLMHKVTFGLTTNGFARAVVFLALTFAFCWASYWYVERPSMNQLRRYLTGKLRQPRLAPSRAT